jgi:hypothetical protein
MLRVVGFIVTASVYMYFRNVYGMINSTTSPSSDAGNVIEHRLTSQVGRVREVVCA